MNEFRESLLVLVSVPIYTLVIGFELFYSYIKNKGFYSTNGTLSNIYLTALNMGLDILIRGFCLVLLNYFYRFHVIDLSIMPIIYWTVLVIFEDFMYYWLHRIDHYCRFFWAVHVTHHNSEEFNLTVGFRSSVFQPLYRFIYFIPIALMGFKDVATGHGFRSTASTILNENGYRADVIERQLAHCECNQVRAVYNHAEYLPERKEMMQWWGDYLESKGMVV